jgi:HD-GYP domain-containing protein (c-di-GMP phosphodiesterase class II)
MAKSLGLQSIFSQELDRAVFITYLLGAVVPLLALVIVTERFALPAFQNDKQVTIGLIAAIGAVALLSLGSFLALRQITRSALQRLNAQGARLTALLDTSRQLAGATHASEAIETAVRTALTLCDASVAMAIMRHDKEQPLTLNAQAGDDPSAFHRRRESDIQEIVEAALAQGTAVTVDDATDSAMAAVPFHGEGLEGAFVVARVPGTGAFAPESIDAVGTLATLGAVAFDNADLRDAQRNFFAHVTDLLVTALDSHVETRDGHASHVAQLSNAMGRQLGLSDVQLQKLHFSSLLHDIGMLRVPRDQHRIPAHFRRHVQIGHRLLSRIRVWEELAPVVMHHHENFDGSGYPEGISGDSIPIEARIIRVADAFDAMTRDDVHRDAKTTAQAIEELQRCAGTQFDPDVVSGILRLEEQDQLPS